MAFNRNQRRRLFEAFEKAIRKFAEDEDIPDGRFFRHEMLCLFVEHLEVTSLPEEEGDECGGDETWTD